MQSYIHQIQKLPIVRTQWLLVIVALLVAIQIQHTHYGWLNSDSVIYLESARLFSIGDWQAAVKVFPWPLYAIGIAAIHKVSTLIAFTALNIHQSAIVLNVLLFGITAYYFFKLIELAGGKSLELISGALILLSSQYIVGDVLSMLMRDEGFWAFYLAGLVFFIRFNQYGGPKNAILWQVCMGFATLFRIEGITYLILLPFILLCAQSTAWDVRIKRFLQANSVSILAVLVIFTAIMLSNQLSIQSFGRLQEVFGQNAIDELTKQFLAKSEIMRIQVLGKFLEEFAIPGLLLTFVYVILIKAFTAPGWIASCLALLNLYYKPEETPNIISRRVLIGAMAISLFNMVLIITKVFVLTGRYVIALAWPMIIFATFQLARLLLSTVEPTNDTKKYQQSLVIGLLLIMSLGLLKNVLPVSMGYDYQRQAVFWLQQQNSTHKPVFYDDSKLIFYANAPYKGTWQSNEAVTKAAIEDKTIYEYEYLAITQSKKNVKEFALIKSSLPQYQEIKRFSDRKKKKSVVIYKKMLDKSI